MPDPEGAFQLLLALIADDLVNDQCAHGRAGGRLTLLPLILMKEGFPTWPMSAPVAARVRNARNRAALCCLKSRWRRLPGPRNYMSCASGARNAGV